MARFFLCKIDEGKKLTLGWIFHLAEHQLTRAMQALIAENYADLFF